MADDEKLVARVAAAIDAPIGAMLRQLAEALETGEMPSETDILGHVMAASNLSIAAVRAYDAEHGMVTVPLVPTHSQKLAGMNAMHPPSMDFAHNVYDAMLAAAPQREGE